MVFCFGVRTNRSHIQVGSLEVDSFHTFLRKWHGNLMEDCPPTNYLPVKSFDQRESLKGRDRAAPDPLQLHGPLKVW